MVDARWRSGGPRERTTRSEERRPRRMVARGGASVDGGAVALGSGRHGRRTPEERWSSGADDAVRGAAS
jgi:hypothetical protein